MVNHIITLLKFHDYVIISGLGGFISHYEPAKRSLSTQTITPPSKKLAFNKSLQENDGLLVNQIAAAENLSQVAAKAKIEAFKNQVEESLEQSGAYLFSGIGKLMFDARRNLQFYPILHDNLLLDSFGLERVVAQPIQRIKEAFEDAKKVVAVEAEAIVEPKVVPLNSNEVYQPVIFRAAAAIGLLFVISTVFMSLFNGNVDTSQFSFLPVQQPNEVQESYVGNETIIDAPVIVEDAFVLFTPVEILPVIENTAVETEVIESTQTNIAATKANSNTYHIIVGSFLNDTRMNREIANMQAKGFNVTTIAGPKGYTRVALQFEETNTSKQTQLQTIRSTVNSDAWMMGN